MTGPELYDRRRKKGWTQAQLSEKLGVDRSTLQRWETGKTAISGKMAKLLTFTFNS